MSAVITRGKITRADLALWDGKTATATRVDATGGTVTGLAIGNDVDVLQVYGGSTARNRATIAAAIQAIGSTACTLVFATGTWTIDADLTIPANFACRIPSGCLIQVESGITLTIAGSIDAGLHRIFSGSGTVTLSGAGLCVPQWWGAKGDGANNDTAAINGAITSGAPVYIPPTGNYYLVNAALTLGAGQQLFGDGYKSYIRCDTTDINIVTITSKANCSVHGLRLRAAGTSTGDALGNAIMLTTATDFTLENLWIENGRNGVYIRTNSARGLLRGLNVQNSVGQYGVLIIGGTDIAVTDSVFKAATAMSEAVQTNIEGTTRNKRITVSGCTIDLVSSTSAGQTGISFRYTDGGAISDNVIAMATGAEATNSRMGVIVNHSTHVAVSSNYVTGGQAVNPTNISEAINVGDSSTDITVTGNVVDAYTAGIRFAALRGAITGNHIRATKDGYGILADAGTLSDGHVSITGNTISTTTGAAGNGDGIRVEKLRYVTISGNVVRSADRFGVYIVDSEYVSAIGNNVAKSDGQGIYANTSPRTIISGNHVIDNNEDNTADVPGISIIGADDCIVSSNISGNAAGTGNQKYGIRIENAACDRTLIQGNNVQDNATAGISDLGTATRISNNKGYVTENGGATSAIATGATVAHGLATTPTTVVVTAQDATPTDVTVSAIGATTFVVNYGGGGTHVFSWEAKLASHYG